MRAASTNSPTPLSHSILAGSTTTGLPTGSGVARKRSQSTPEPRIKTAAWGFTRPFLKKVSRSSGFWKMVRLLGFRVVAL